jgi:hypothetical protein
MPEELASAGTGPVESTPDSMDSALPDNYLDDPGQSESQEYDVASDGNDDVAGDADVVASAADPLQARIAELAKKYGLDPNIPNQLKALKDLAITEKRMGDKDTHIAKLQKLTPFEESLQQSPERTGQDQVPAFARGEQARPAGEQEWVDPFPHWRQREDALSDFITAINEGFDKKDMRGASRVFQEMFRREMHPYRDAIQGMIREELSGFEREKLGDVLPDVRKTVAERAASNNRQFAEKQLRTDAQFSADLDQLRKPLSDKVHEFDGEQYPDTMLNRIVMEKPYILRIRVDHQDPKTAQILTHMEQLRAIRREMASQQHSPAKGKELVRAGAEMAKRESNKERARQGLNGGASSGGNSKAANDDYVSEIIASRPKRLSDYK